MELDLYLQWVHATAVARVIRENEIIFPWIEAAHVLTIVLVVGTIVIVDLRLLGLASLDRAATRVMREMLPYTWAAFVVAVITGTLLFASNAMTYAHNFYFQGKLVLLGAAGLNMALFHFFSVRGIDGWDMTGRTPFAAKAAAGFSLILWVSVVTFGRWIGFTLR